MDAQFSSAWFTAIGTLLVIAGLLHTTPVFQRADTQLFMALHTHLRPYTGFFRFIWPLGTTPVGILLILILFIASWQIGLVTAVVYLVTAVIEWALKRTVGRPRPFESLPGVVMNQPKTPHDASHPSGDTMRVCFLAVVFPFAFYLPWFILALALLTAFILGLGRIVLGVHYPLDVIGGAGLGLLAAGLTLTVLM